MTEIEKLVERLRPCPSIACWSDRVTNHQEREQAADAIESLLAALKGAEGELDEARAKIEVMHRLRLKLDRRIHNQRRAAGITWEIVEMRRKWLGSHTARISCLRRERWAKERAEKAERERDAAVAALRASEPYAYLCTSLQFSTEIVYERAFAEERAARPERWTVTPMYLGNPLSSRAALASTGGGGA